MTKKRVKKKQITISYVIMICKVGQSWSKIIIKNLLNHPIILLKLKCYEDMNNTSKTLF